MNFEQLAVFNLSTGSHKSAEEGVCAMEAVAWLEGLPHTDRPECTCPVIAAYVRGINDNMPDRSLLIPYLPRLVGTVSLNHEHERAEYLAWQAIRVFAPATLRAFGLNRQAQNLEVFRGDLSAAAAASRAAARAARAAVVARAADAAYAAAYAAADAAADAAAVAAAAAAAAAAYAAYAADDAAVWPMALAALDGVLAIGPQSSGFSAPVERRIEAYRELITQ